MFGFMRGMMSNNAAPKSSIINYYPFSCAWGSTANPSIRASQDEDLIQEISDELQQTMLHMQSGRVDDAMRVLEGVIRKVDKEGVPGVA